MSEENDQPGNQGSVIFSWVMIGIIIVTVLFILITNSQRKAAKKKVDAEYNQTYMEEYKLFADCELGLKSLLKSPASYQLVKKHTNIGFNRGIVNLTYDAENSFGAKLRGEFACTFKRDKDAVENPKPFYLAGASLNGDELTLKEIVVLQVDIVKAWLSMQ